ncbi:MAG: hypothetical protein IK093_16765 [Ruminiclostridium sp.]|nr:hypothetical protein [Ruminiclostridium sp.]
MLNVFTVEVVCPATSRSYDFVLPARLEVGELRHSIIEDICTYEDISGLIDADTTLLFCNGDQLFDGADLVSQGVHNGDKIYLV